MAKLDSDRRRINHALFTSYEPVRLWLKEHNERAPFQKIVVSLDDKATAGPWQGNVANSGGVCEITEVVDIPTLESRAVDHRWVLGVVQHALGCVSRCVGWQSHELNAAIETLSNKPLPLLHLFRRLARIHEPTGANCVPWLSTQPGETRVGVRLTRPGEPEFDVTVISEAGPLFMEDSFPLAKTAFRGSNFVLLDRSGKVLHAVALTAAL
ncbi:MAG TPA: hypothetical protein VI072_34175 [Polyangiaceae bacterium]